MKLTHSFSKDDIEKRFKGHEARKGELGMGELLSQCANRAAEKRMVLDIERIDEGTESMAIVDPTLCIEAVMRSIEVMSIGGRCPVRVSVRSSLKSVEIILANNLAHAGLPGLGDRRRNSARLSVLRIWLQEHGVLARKKGEVETGISIRLFFEAISGGKGEPSKRIVQPGKRRVLLVEDYRDSCTFFASQLRDLGYAVAEAHSAENAIQILDTEPGFEFGVFDLNLPGLSGEQLAAYCHAQDDLKRMKLIAISGESSRLPNRIFDGCLAKPFELENLKRMLERVSSDCSVVS